MAFAEVIQCPECQRFAMRRHQPERWSCDHCQFTIEATMIFTLVAPDTDGDCRDLVHPGQTD